jgi:hypothetical protein
VHSFSGKKGDVSSLITKAKAKCRSLERYLQRTPAPPAAEGAWISAAEFFDWHGRAQDVDLEVYQQLSASVYDALVYYITDAKAAHVISGVQADDGAALLKKLRSAEGSTRQQVLNRNEAMRSENLHTMHGWPLFRDQYVGSFPSSQRYSRTGCCGKTYT